VLLKAIFRVVPTGVGHLPRVTDRFLAYVQRCDTVNQVNRRAGRSGRPGKYPDPVTGCYIVKPVLRSNGELMGAIVPVEQIQTLVDLVPLFGKEANARTTRRNVLAIPGASYYLNKYFTRTLFHSLSQ